MNSIEEKLNIPATGVIMQKLGLEYDGQLEMAEPEATYSYSVPVITDDCPGRLQYFPLNKNSEDGLSEHFDREELLQKIEGKKYCVIICNSYDKLDQEGSRTSYNPYGGSPAYIAAVWDATEDPLMATTLYSCTFLTEAAPHEAPSELERVPLFLKEEEVQAWLHPTDDLQKKEILNRV
ncbi:SOS response-associated peptidase family protein [Pedobacter sp. SYSU D00535]|uniref:SOS response-associated peptidase family protein n=1 Tax=Pedobacter sp. SYSU D00535 TaxID=2810308 RepID=UPI001A96D948|nr:SOS response-associated peptidase family protein [Pedobacter sp. SYSU D00535]